MALYLERALFVVAPPNAGKSVSLRSLLIDRRIVAEGEASTAPRLKDAYHLSSERRLHIRLMSPHEAGDTPDEFHWKAETKMGNGRWNFAGALQPLPRNRMPDVVRTVALFQEHFEPERVRVAFLDKTRQGLSLDDYSDSRDLRDELLALEGVEVICIDGRRKHRNGLLLADFFDFT